MFKIMRLKMRQRSLYQVDEVTSQAHDVTRLLADEPLFEWMVRWRFRSSTQITVISALIGVFVRGHLWDLDFYFTHWLVYIYSISVVILLWNRLLKQLRILIICFMLPEWKRFIVAYQILENLCIAFTILK